MWSVAILIVPAFVVWNVGTAVKNRKSGYYGKIFGKKISWNKFNREKQASKNNLLFRYGDKLDESINLDEQAWTRLILLHAVKERNIKVTNEELLTYIKKLPFFAADQLDPRVYTEIVANIFHQSTTDFEQGIKNSLAIDKLMRVIGAGISASTQEVKKVYTQENEKASVFYVLINPDDFLSTVSMDNETEIIDYYNSHKEDFKKPEQVAVEYISIKLDDLKTKISLTEEQIKKYYERNKEKFSIEVESQPESPKTEDTIAIQYKSLEEVKDEITNQLIEKQTQDKAIGIARQMISKLYSETDLTKIAAEHNLKVEETGPFSMLEEIPNVGLSFPFLKAAFSLKTGEISEIIKTPAAYYILKLMKKIKPYIPEYKDITDNVKQAYTKAKSIDLAGKKAKEIAEQIRGLIKDKNLNFTDAAKQLNLTLKSAENFTRTGYVNEIGYAKNFTETAFSLTPDEISEPLQTSRGFCILKTNKITPIDEENFNKQKDKYTRQVVAKKRNAYLMKWFSELKERANLQTYENKNQR